MHCNYSYSDEGIRLVSFQVFFNATSFVFIAAFRKTLPHEIRKRETKRLTTWPTVSDKKERKTKMTTVLDTALKKPCIEYKARFVASELEKVKLYQNYDDGSKKEKKCPIFSGKEGIEGLLYVEERFRKVAKQLNYDEGEELYSGFEEVLTDSAEDHWENVVTNIPDNQKTVARLNISMQQFYLKYCDDEARDVLIMRKDAPNGCEYTTYD